MQRSMEQKRFALLAKKLTKALESRNFEAYYCETREGAVQQALSLMQEGTSVSWGGSVSLNEAGLLDAVRQGNYTLVDRDVESDPQKRYELMRQALLCDTYLTSVNAITEDGLLVNVDSTGNRVAAMTFGPNSVIAVVGMNKVCRDLDDAVSRARNHAAPINALRLSLDLNTPCAKTGSCANCKVDDCICSYIVVTRRSKVKGRIKVILVGENLGY